MMPSAKYPYYVSFRRTSRWFHGEWAEICDWINSSITQDMWDYNGYGFVFKQEQDALAFKLRWGENNVQWAAKIG